MNENTIDPHPMKNRHLLQHEFEYIEPLSLKETLSFLEEYGGHARVMSGGTNLLVQVKMEEVYKRQKLQILRRKKGKDL